VEELLSRYSSSTYWRYAGYCSFKKNWSLFSKCKYSRGFASPGAAYIATQIEEQMKEISRKLEAYRRHKQYDSKLEDKIVILVDDGIATDLTIFAAAQWIKAQKCRQRVIAVPVDPKGTIKKLEEVADIVVAINAPESFQAVGQFYQDFSQVIDEEVKAIMHKHSYKPIGYRQSLAE
jgi:predicted phosphoribosyltransferase